MIGIDPETGLSVSGAQQAAQRLKRAITTEIGSRNKRRKVGGNFRRQYGIANEEGRMIAINRIHRIIANPHNDLSDIQNPIVKASIKPNADGYYIRVTYDYKGQLSEVEL